VLELPDQGVLDEHGVRSRHGRDEIVGKLERKKHWEDFDVDGRIILK
jgi:hypothetical protein